MNIYYKKNINRTDGAGGSGSSGVDRDSFSRWRDRQYYGPRRWFQSSREETQWEKDNGSNFIEIFLVSGSHL